MRDEKWGKGAVLFTTFHTGKIGRHPEHPTYFLISSSFAVTKREPASVMDNGETQNDHEIQTLRSLSRIENGPVPCWPSDTRARNMVFIEF